MTCKKVAVAMSGGVDSSVAAAKMLEEGHEVIGLTMRVWSDPQYETGLGESCDLHDDAAEAERVARHLGIPHFELDVRETFKEEVVCYFIDEYRRGRTPNPCIVCNHRFKFGALLEKALSLGAEKMATGHYARVGWEPKHRRYYLKKGIDSGKDQSYMLYRLNQEQLAKSIFPLGGSSKEIIRARALQLGLNMDEKKESQEICFIPGDDYREFLRRLVGTFPPGPIIDTGGNYLGEHRGLPFYTIGQRKGLGVVAAEPLYVVDLRTADNTLVVGT
ncbi:MAG: tRNA 2-thiouridine(34) synthase MnmA, partial [Firmicutes bacterium]|nr:tRNA 2-thiouridine(34) synthase MnmA [Bacillota bacterium]